MHSRVRSAYDEGVLLLHLQWAEKTAGQ
jgi:hypothetical protein